VIDETSGRYRMAVKMRGRLTKNKVLRYDVRARLRQKMKSLSRIRKIRTRDRKKDGPSIHHFFGLNVQRRMIDMVLNITSGRYCDAGEPLADMPTKDTTQPTYGHLTDTSIV